MKFPEAGYTPANLRYLLDRMSWTQAHAAELCGVTPQTMRRWLAKLDTASHRDMPLDKWQSLLQISGIDLLH